MTADNSPPVFNEQGPLDQRGNELPIITFILAQMTLMEGRLMGAIKTHSDAETERWVRHEKEHERDVALWKQHRSDHDNEINSLGTPDERRVLIGRIRDHIAAEETEDLVMRTRLEPVKTAAGFLRREWRTIMLGAAIIGQAILSFLDRARIAG